MTSLPQSSATSTKNNKEVIINLSNLTTNTVTVSPSAILCELHPVSVDESVFQRTEDSVTEKIFSEIHIDSNLAKEQDEKVRDLLMKHLDIF